MKVLRPFTMFSLMLLFVACGETKNSEENEELEEAEVEYQDPEMAMGEWNDAWSSNDPQKIFDETADDVLVVLNGTEVPADSVQGFIEESGAAMKDLNMQSLAKGSTDKMAYDTGTYTHQYNNSDTTRYEGTYTFIWERQDDEADWKVTVMNISDKSQTATQQQANQ